MLLPTIAWATIAAVTAWGLTWVRAAAAISRLREQMRQEVRYWQDESARAKARAAQLAKDIATWTGWLQTRSRRSGDRVAVDHRGP